MRRLIAVLGTLLLGAFTSDLASAATRVVDSDVRLLHPSETRPTTEQRVTFRIQLPVEGSPFLLSLDGLDVSALAQQAGREISYRPDQPLRPGPHRLRVIWRPPEGRSQQEWTITVAAVAADGSVPVGAFARGSVSASTSAAVSEQGSKARSPSGSATLAMGASRGSLEAMAQGSLSWTTDGPGERVLPGGFLVAVKQGESGLSYGDVTVVGTPQLGASLARRGLLLDLRGERGRFQAFQLASEPVRGLDLGIRFDSLNDQLIGASASAAFLADRSLQVAAMVLQGETSGAPAGGASSFGSSSGRAAGLQLGGKLLGTTLAAEGSLSELDRGQGAQRDYAVAVRAGRPVGPVSLSGSYERLGPSFGSIASPFTVADRQQLGLSASAGLGPASLSASVSRSNDNLGKDLSRPVVTSLNGAAGMSLALRNWPVMNLAYTHGLLGATSVPAGHPGVDSTTDSASADFSWARGPVAASLTGAMTWLDDRRPAGTSSVSSSVQLAGNLRPVPWLTLVPMAAHQESQSGGQTRLADLASLGLRLGLPRALTLDGQGSYGFQRVSDGSSNLQQRSGLLRLGWAVGPFLGPPGRGLQATLAATGRYDLLLDRGPSARSVESWGAFLGLDLLLPVDLRTGP
jgi:hypothetical protein